MQFSELEFKKCPDYMIAGLQALHTFPNGYTASVLYGGKAYTTNGTYEMAVLDKDMELDYSTPITEGGVLAYQTKEEIQQALYAIEALPQK